MQNRQKEEIYRDILTVCNGGASITRIMFHGYMTHLQAKAYASQLVQAGLLEQDTASRKFATTPKGMEYLSLMGSMSELLPMSTKRSAKLHSLSPLH